MGTPMASVPQLLWKYYVDYLWFYEPDSWVARTANGARVLAILVALPIVILALLVRNDAPTNNIALTNSAGYCLVRHSTHAWCYRRC